MWILLLALFGAASAIPWDEQTALDTYVHSDDGHYSYEILVTHRPENTSCTLYIVNMTSQKYQDESYVDRPYWWHIMGIAVPDDLVYPDAGFMLVNGGGNRNDDSPPDADDFAGWAICLASSQMGVVGAYLSQIPNQPLYFANDPTQKRRSEDSIIAWTWRTFIDSPDPDPEVILRMPMTKAAKRGLDTISAVAQAHPGGTEVNRFLVFGASKRGWTTWSLAATDQRVIAAAPMVFSMLNFPETLASHYRAMGGAWSFAFGSYWNENLTQELLTPEANAAFQFEDMYVYRERLTIPLLQLVSTGDEFFLCQDSHHWWDDLPPPKWTYMMENAEHGMFPHYLKLYDTVTAFYSHILEGRQSELPTLSWTMHENDTHGFIDVTSDTTPEETVLYQAVTLPNDTRRDFRLAEVNPDSEEGIDFHPVLWLNTTSTGLTQTPGENRWRATVEKVVDEWVGFLVSFKFRDPTSLGRYFLTTETNIVPNTFPVEACDSAESCWGVLV